MYEFVYFWNKKGDLSYKEKNHFKSFEQYYLFYCKQGDVSQEQTLIKENSLHNRFYLGFMFRSYV